MEIAKEFNKQHSNAITTTIYKFICESERACVCVWKGTMHTPNDNGMKITTDSLLNVEMCSLSRSKSLQLQKCNIHTHLDVLRHRTMLIVPSAYIHSPPSLSIIWYCIFVLRYSSSYSFRSNNKHTFQHFKYIKMDSMYTCVCVWAFFSLALFIPPNIL